MVDVYTLLTNPAIAMPRAVREAIRGGNILAVFRGCVVEQVPREKPTLWGREMVVVGRATFEEEWIFWGPILATWSDVGRQIAEAMARRIRAERGIGQ